MLTPLAPFSSGQYRNSEETPIYDDGGDVIGNDGNTRTRSGTVTLADGATRLLAEYRFARDNAETKFLDWREVPQEIAVLPRLTLGGVQMDLDQALVRDAEEGWRGHPPGALRAKLDACLAVTAIAAEYASNSDWRQAA